jgi:hypothetical protein
VKPADSVFTQVLPTPSRPGIHPSGQKQCDGGAEDQFLVDSKISCFHSSMTVRVLSSPGRRSLRDGRTRRGFLRVGCPLHHAERTTLPRPLKERILAEFQIKRVTVSKSYN